MQIGCVEDGNRDQVLLRDFRPAGPRRQHAGHGRSGEEAQKFTAIGRTNIHGRTPAILMGSLRGHNLIRDEFRRPGSNGDLCKLE
jgi:hypothetical protein